MNSTVIRKKFLDYFAKNGHTVVASSSLIPADDPTILFANAGMNQFKDVFLGKEKRSYVRATSSQKCVRAGGKHNDLDQVGFTARHLTFFEMLGNFSFGDYFKKEAIRFAWEFLTQEMGLAPEKLYISVFEADDEAAEIWHKEIGVPLERIIRLGAKDNFWQMGDTGPCGPCTEIYVDRGRERGCGKADCKPGCDCSGFTEIWNLVFMQYNRQADGTLQPLTQTGVDTGMGLERLAMVMQGKETIFHADTFWYLIEAIEKLSGVQYATSPEKTQAAFHVLTDHVRSSSLLIADGCSPSNDGRGYVLRKIIRRAALFAQKLSPDQTLFVSLANVFIDNFSAIYPELATNRTLITSLLDSEVRRFALNLEQGQHIFVRYLEQNKAAGINRVTGQQAFKLYDTYGFPPELTRVMALDQGLEVDFEGFEQEMKKQQEQSGQKTAKGDRSVPVVQGLTTTFVGYETLSCTSPVQYVQMHDDHAWIITQESPFYVECGGQINDKGTVTIGNNTYPVADLAKVGEQFSPAIAVRIDFPTGIAAQINEGDVVLSQVDATSRANTVKNHTATHMLQAALVSVLGPQVKQAGSVVTPDYLRFDFSHHQPLSAEQIEQIERIVNEKIQQDIVTQIGYMTLDKAREQGVVAFFGEKYNPENVRVVKIPGFSAELCGGTHASSTGIIGCFKITSETALAAGTRRIVAVTGPEAVTLFQQSYSTIKKLGDHFKVKPEQVADAVNQLQEQQKALHTQLRQARKQLLELRIPQLAAQAQAINGMHVLVTHIPDLSNDELRAVVQELDKTVKGLVAITTQQGNADQISFVAQLHRDVQSKLSLKDLAQTLQAQCGIRGGGSAASLQGGGPRQGLGGIQTTVHAFVQGA